MIKKPQYFSIGALAKKTGCKITTIRYYENEGLLHDAYRTEGNQRRYEESHLKRLQFIRHARELGFKQTDIQELIQLSSKKNDNHQADEIASKHLKEITHKIVRLKTLKKELSHMLESCDKSDSESCNVVDVLSDHALCIDNHD